MGCSPLRLRPTPRAATGSHDGFYRVRYEPELMSRLRWEVVNKTIPPSERIGLLDDLLLMVKCGLNTTDELLGLLQCYENEDNPSVISKVCDTVDTLNILFEYTELYDQFKDYAILILKSIVANMSWEGYFLFHHATSGDEPPHLVRGLVYLRLVRLGDEETMDLAFREYFLHTQGEILIHDLRVALNWAVLSTEDEYADIKITFDSLLRIRKSSKDSRSIIESLGAMRDEALLVQALEFAMSKDSSTEESLGTFKSVCMTKKGRDTAWTFLMGHFRDIRLRYNMKEFETLLKILCENFADETKAGEIKRVLKKKTGPDFSLLASTISNITNTICLNSRWVQRDAKVMKEYFNVH